LDQTIAELSQLASIHFGAKLKSESLELKRVHMDTLQVNIGKLCNQACRHCHVESGPTKTRENMDSKTFEKLCSLIDASRNIQTLDITGGAPELNPHFRSLVKFARSKGIEVIDRCNLTVLFEPGQEDTAAFLAEQGAQVVASLPCYSRKNVDQQRGNGVFDKSIRGLQMLNELGYGKEGSGLSLNLVYNPGGPSLPPAQETLQEQYKVELKEDFGIEFNQLFTITNMPIKRFLVDLKRAGKLEEYMNLLVQSFNPTAVDSLMCKSLVSISWDGRIYDCDFNQMLNIELAPQLPRTIWEMESFDELENSKILTADHCYGCTAGAGSSCTGALL